MGRPPGSTGFKGVRKDFRRYTGKTRYRAFIRPQAATTSASSQQQSLHQGVSSSLLPDDIHAAAVLVWCAEAAYTSAKAAGVSRVQLKGCRRDVHAATEQLAAAMAAAALAMAPARHCHCSARVKQSSGQQGPQEMQQNQQQQRLGHGQCHGQNSTHHNPMQHLPAPVVLLSAGTRHRQSASVTYSDTATGSQALSTKRQRLKQLMMAVAAGRTSRVKSGSK